MMIPEDAPVRLLNAQLEELEYGKLYEAYSSKGENRRRIHGCCSRYWYTAICAGSTPAASWRRPVGTALTSDGGWRIKKRRIHSTLARFRTGRCRGVVEALFYQFVHKLEGMGETDHKAVFIDGTKLESCAGRYTFVWRKTVEKQLAQVKEKLRSMTGLSDSEAVRRKLEKEAETIQFVEGKGKRKSQAQRDWEAQKGLLERWERYEEMRATLGEGRNSYSKTDPDATFMRMKEDHMRNGQLKPGYNVQIAVNSEYITGVEAFSDRTDVRTLRPMLEKLTRWHQARYEEVVADAGYESLENYLYLERMGSCASLSPPTTTRRRPESFKTGGAH